MWILTEHTFIKNPYILRELLFKVQLRFKSQMFEKWEDKLWPIILEKKYSDSLSDICT